ncbi:MAG TPA: type II CAAX endopeptidase family protein [Candidatus Baltobacteraceae bacterium]|nr:type II CAAX endopeptidase family protein [Candidatus Baltobacteraceae bacterium]
MSLSKVPPIWRAFLYFGLASWIALPLADRLWAYLAAQLHIGTELSAGSTFFYELELLVVAALVTGVLAFFERRRIDDYGMPLKGAFGALFWEGLLVGLIWAGLDAVVMIALGGMRISGLALGGWVLVRAAASWAVANVMVGVAEEFWYRSYFLQTLWKGLGFWPAAIVVSLIFTSDHYFYKSGENLYDVVSLLAFGIFACYTVLRTGSLWFVVGAHAAYDFMQFFVIGSPNGTQIPVDRLFNVTFPGPAWLTGGVLGTEASVIEYPVCALAFLYVWWRFKKRASFSPPPN